MSYKEDYENMQMDFENSNKVMIETRTGIGAISELESLNDSEEVFSLDGYFEGVITFINEDGSKTIDICYGCTAGVNIQRLIKIKDLLFIAEQTNINYVKLSTWQ